MQRGGARVEDAWMKTSGLLASLAVWLLLAGCGAPRVEQPDPRIDLAAEKMAAIDQRIQIYFLEHGRMARSLRAVVGAVPRDPWGNPYHYEVPSDGRAIYRLSSAGADGVLGSGDDLQIGAIR